VARDTPAGAVAATIQAAGGGLLRGLSLFDVYTGPPLGEAERSLAWRLTFSAAARTLTDAEVDAAMAAVVARLAADVGGRVRS
jgi:phenylalanyl-tRNA synthetase beta chain